jgi:hypothetical protein
MYVQVVPTHEGKPVLVSHATPHAPQLFVLLSDPQPELSSPGASVAVVEESVVASGKPLGESIEASPLEDPMPEEASCTPLEEPPEVPPEEPLEWPPSRPVVESGPPIAASETSPES